jgi:translation elongation factor EF-Ts
MALLRRKQKKSRTQQAADLAVDYLKLKAATKAAKGAGSAAKGTAVVVATKSSKKARLGMLAGVAAVAVVAAKLVRGHGNSEPATA